MAAAEYNGRLEIMACHIIDACNNQMPRVKSLLGLGFNFCLQKTVSDLDVNKTMSRLREDVQRKYFFANRERRRQKETIGNTFEDST